MDKSLSNGLFRALTTNYNPKIGKIQQGDPHDRLRLAGCKKFPLLYTP
jgi:hypothetical protein